MNNVKSKFFYRTFIYSNVNKSKLVINALSINNENRQKNIFILKSGYNILNVYYYNDDWITYLLLDNNLLDINIRINNSKFYEIIDLSDISISQITNIKKDLLGWNYPKIGQSKLKLFEKNLIAYYNLPDNLKYSYKSKSKKSDEYEIICDDSEEETDEDNNKTKKISHTNISSFFYIKPNWLNNKDLSNNIINTILKSYNCIKLKFKISNIVNGKLILYVKINNKISGCQSYTFVIEKNSIRNKTFYVLNSGWFHMYKLMWYIKDTNKKIIKSNFNEKLHSYMFIKTIDIKI